MSLTTLIIGASPKEDRYSNKAHKLLKAHGHTVIPFAPKKQTIEGDAVITDLKEIPTAIDTVTLYVRPERLEPLVDDLIALKPRRVIFNPGTESEAIQGRLSAAGIEGLEACTLVLLNTGQY